MNWSHVLQFLLLSQLDYIIKDEFYQLYSLNNYNYSR